MKKQLKRIGVIIAITALTIVGPPSAAHATSRTCTINGAFYLPHSCWTDSVWANSTGHWVDIHIDSHFNCESDYVVRDIANNVVVGFGRAGDTSRTIFGLFSAYRLEVTRIGSGCGGVFWIENEW